MSNHLILVRRPANPRIALIPPQAQMLSRCFFAFLFADLDLQQYALQKSSHSCAVAGI